MLRNPKTLGALGERFAVNYLKKSGYKIRETNYRTSFGEIDIVALRKKTVVFVEVKTLAVAESDWRVEDRVFPEESVGEIKMKKLVRLGEHYMQTQRKKDVRDSDWQIDVIAVEIDPSTEKHILRHIKNAVST